MDFFAEIDINKTSLHKVALEKQLRRVEYLLLEYFQNLKQQIERLIDQNKNKSLLFSLQTIISFFDILPIQEDENQITKIDKNSRFQKLIDHYGLTKTEQDILLVTLLPLYNSIYANIFQVLQKSGVACPTIGLLSDIIVNKKENNALQDILMSGSLLDHCLVSIVNPDEINWQLKALQSDIELYNYLLGIDTILNAQQSGYKWLSATSLSYIKSPIVKQLKTIISLKKFPLLIYLIEKNQSGKTFLLQAMTKSDKYLLSIDLSCLPSLELQACDFLQKLLRNAELYQGCLLLENLNELEQQRPTVWKWLERKLAQIKIPLFALCSQQTITYFKHLPQIIIDIPNLTLQEKNHLLKEKLNIYNLADNVDINALASRFQFQPELLDTTLHEADIYRALTSKESYLSQQNIIQALAKRSQQVFGNLAQRVVPKRNFDDIVISDDTRTQIDQVLAAIRQRTKILEQGFAQKIGYGTGISVLFHGDSGTGKTLVAEILAKALGVDLIKVDLATVVNKYIGETEKNLATIFDKAEQDSGVLFFDEADALFGKRSETKDSHDRYANIEVSYLLQRFENYPGLVILATNNRHNLDEAFTRRLTFIVRFPYPDEILRERLWKNIWPTTIKLSEDIDFNELAKRVKITGANIRNIALLASWLAADEGAPYVSYQHIELALQSELSKLGRLKI